MFCISMFQSSIVVEIPLYNKKTANPVQVQFYVSNGKRRRSLMQSFTYLPRVRCDHPSTVGVKQESRCQYQISYNPPGFCPASGQAPSHDVFRPDVVCYDSCDLPVHYGLPSPNSPGLCHPLSSSLPLQASVIFTQTSSVPHQTLIPRQTSTMPPQTITIPVQIPTIPSQASSVPPQTLSVPCHTSSGEPLRKQSQFLSYSSTFKTLTDPQKDSLLCSPGEVLSIKQETDDQPHLGSLGLREITLDDGRKQI